MNGDYRGILYVVKGFNKKSTIKLGKCFFYRRQGGEPYEAVHVERYCNH